MINQSKVYATIAVSDINEGKKFYGDTLGLEQVDENPGGVTYTSGGAKFFVYQSTTAGKGEATCAAWDVEDIAAEVEALKSKGVTFEHYELPGSTLDGDIHTMGPMKAAWFKDLDGNILSLSEMGEA